jgi:HSP20 family protein
MAIARWTPMGDMTSLHSAMERLFGELLQGDVAGGESPGTLFRLPVDITESEKGYVIRAPIPGFSPEEVEVAFSDGVLTIVARHTEDRPQQEGNYIRRETRWVNFMRQIALPSDVRADDIQASFENGELIVEVPRAPRPQPTKIDVQRRQRSTEKDQAKMQLNQGQSESKLQSKESQKTTNEQPAAAGSQRSSG